MTQGIFVGRGRPASKKAVKLAVENDPKNVRIEATSVFGNEYDGLLSEMPKVDQNNKPTSVVFVGPNPYSDRRFYGTIKWSIKKQTWVVS